MSYQTKAVDSKSIIVTHLFTGHHDRLSARDLNPRGHRLHSNLLPRPLDGISPWIQKEFRLVLLCCFLSCTHYWCSMLSGHNKCAFQCQSLYYMGCLHVAWDITIDPSLHRSFIASVSSIRLT